MRAVRTGKRAATLLMAAGSIALAMAFAEGVLRLAAHRLLHEGETLAVGTIFNLDDPLLGFSPVPGSSRIIARGGAYLVRDRINSLGLRDIEHPIERRPSVSRILVLGDSFMFGDGVPMGETMPRRLASLMPETEVINSGVRAWDLGQEYLYFRHQGRRFRPDLVLLAFFVNDLTPERGIEVTWDPEGLPVSYRRRPDLAQRDRERTPGGIRGTFSAWMREHSMLYVLVRQRLDRAGVRRRAAGVPAKDNAADTPFLPAFHADPGEAAAESWRRAHRILNEIKSLAEEGGARLAIILIPAPWQTSPQDWQRWVEWLGAEPGTLSRWKPQEMVSAWCGRTATPCLDLMDVFEGTDRRRFYFLHDHHWTAAGHDLAARRVARFLRERGLP